MRGRPDPEDGGSARCRPGGGLALYRQPRGCGKALRWRMPAPPLPPSI